MQTSGYVYDPAWEQERERLAGIEAMWDPGTHALLTSYGVCPGCKVLEAGAGGGSVVGWLAEQVATAGHVLAVDLDTRFLEPLASSVVEVRRADLVADDLPEEAFGLVHCRLVLEHLPQREAVLAKLVGALRPGGRLVVEDYDWTAFGIESADEQEQRAAEGVLAFMAAAGFEGGFGRRLVGLLADEGLVDVHGVGRSLVIDAEHPGFPFFALSFEQLAPAAVQGGFMTQEDADAVAGRMRDGVGRIITPTLVAAVGRKPCS